MSDRLERGKISLYQVITLLFFIRLVPRTLICPTSMVATASSDLWVADVLSSFGAAIFVWLVCHLMSCTGGKNLIQYSSDLLGWLPGKIISLLLLGYFLFIASYTTRMLADAFKIPIMRETPRLLFAITIVLVSANAARAGLEVIARTAEYIFPFILLIFFLLLILPYEVINTEYLVPVLADGLRPIIPPTAIEFMFYTEYLILGMILPSLNKSHKASRYLVLFTIANGILLTIMCIVMIAIFGPTLDSLSVQAYHLARMIFVADFLERVESMVLGTWVLSTAVRIAVYIWAASITTAEIFELKSYRPFPYLLGAVVITWSFSFFDDVTHMLRFLAQPWTIVTITGITVLILVLLLVRSLWKVVEICQN